MRRKIIAWCAAILIVALVSYAFLRPSDALGASDTVYGPCYRVPLELSGDTQLIEAIDFGGFTAINGIVSVLLYIKPADDAPLIYLDTDMILRNATQSSGLGGFALMERIVGDETEFICTTGDPYVTIQIYAPIFHIETELLNGEVHLYAKYSEQKAKNDEYIPLHIRFPEAATPGDYRMTLRFRTCDVENGDDYPNIKYTTSEELYSVSFTLTVPKSGRLGDVLGVETHASSYYANDLAYPCFRVGMLYHKIEPLYLDMFSLRIEKLIDGKFSPMSDVSLNIRSRMMDEQYLRDNDTRQMNSHTSERYPEPVCFYPNIFVIADDFDITADYRVTLDFVENEDGSGERYTLQFCMNFSEEG